MKKIFAVMMFLGLGASNAYAIAPCAQVCQGVNEPCKLRCYLDNHFVTTCDQVYGGRCVPIAAVEETEEAEAETVCAAEPTLEPIIAALVEVGTSAFEAVLG